MRPFILLRTSQIRKYAMITMFCWRTESLLSNFSAHFTARLSFWSDFYICLVCGGKVDRLSSFLSSFFLNSALLVPHLKKAGRNSMTLYYSLTLKSLKSSHLLYPWMLQWIQTNRKITHTSQYCAEVLKHALRFLTFCRMGICNIANTKLKVMLRACYLGLWLSVSLHTLL